MKITEDVIRRVATLARLAVNDEEVATLTPQLNDIISYAEQLQDVDFGDVEPTSHSFAMVNVLRDDVARPGLSRTDALANAPDSDGEQVRVPAVLEG